MEFGCDGSSYVSCRCETREVSEWGSVEGEICGGGRCDTQVGARMGVRTIAVENLRNLALTSVNCGPLNNHISSNSQMV